MIAFDDDELLSIGQGALDVPEAADGSLYLQGPRELTPCGTSYRALALYDVRKNLLGIETKWPGLAHYGIEIGGGRAAACDTADAWNSKGYDLRRLWAFVDCPKCLIWLGSAPPR